MRKNLDIPFTLIFTFILTVAMLWPMHQPLPTPDGSDKLAHLAAFAALVFPLTLTRRTNLWLVIIGASAFGGLLELIQPTFNRSADLNDWFADILGVMLGIAFGLIYRQLRNIIKLYSRF